MLIFLPLRGLFGLLMAGHVSELSVLFIVAMYLFPSQLREHRSYSCVKRAIASGRKFVITCVVGAICLKSLSSYLGSAARSHLREYLGLLTVHFQ